MNGLSDAQIGVPGHEEVAIVAIATGGTLAAGKSTAPASSARPRFGHSGRNRGSSQSVSRQPWPAPGPSSFYISGRDTPLLPRRTVVFGRN